MLLNQYTAQNTLGIAGVSKQLCAEAVKMGFLAPINCSNIVTDSDSLVHLYLHPTAVEKLKRIANGASQIIVSTCYRTLAQQYILKRNLTSLVAPVGRSDHGGGRSVDAVNWDEIDRLLERNGYSQTYGSRDAVHWDCDDVGDYRAKTVLAFQQLWNRNSSHQLAEDGLVGSGVLFALANTPVNGFINAECPRYLSFRDSGKDVGKMQFKLRDLGFLTGACDGLFGNQTQAAVIQAQIKFGLNPTGIVGENTRQLLFS